MFLGLRTDKKKKIIFRLERKKRRKEKEGKTKKKKIAASLDDDEGKKVLKESALDFFQKFKMAAHTYLNTIGMIMKG